MKKYSRIVIIILALLVFIPGPQARAEESETPEVPVVVEPEIIEPSPEAPADLLEINISIDVPKTCEVSDSDGTVHSYPAEPGDSYYAICAVQAALDEGKLESAELSNQFPSMGLFITALNGLVADPNSQYWALYLNNSFAELGLASLPVSEGDTIALKLTDFSGNETGDMATISISSLIPSEVEVDQEETPRSSGSRGGRSRNSEVGEVLGAAKEPSFNQNKAYSFLLSQQKEDGSFGEEIFTDWAILALASSQTAVAAPAQTAKMVKYLSTAHLAGTNLTDYERRAMALMALGLNPYSTNGENYIQKILSDFDGQQFGDKEEDNDDIFALLVLSRAGYNISDPEIKNSLDFIVKRQKNDGSWDGSIDMTGAALQVLSIFKDEQEVKDSITKAKIFLSETQKNNGSWGDDPSSTSWAMGGLWAIGEKAEDLNPSYPSPLSYLAALQGQDGGLKEEDLNNKVWKTSYAIGGASGQSWALSLQKFTKPETLEPEVKSPKISLGENKKISLSKKTPKLSAPEIQAVLASNYTAPIKDTDLYKKPAPEPKPQSWLSKFLSLFRF